MRDPNPLDRVAELLMSGHSISAIARRLGLPVELVDAEAVAVKGEWQRRAEKPIEEHRAEHLALLDMLVDALESVLESDDDRLKLDAIKELVAVADSRARLLGTCAPIRREVNIRSEVDLDRLFAALDPLEGDEHE